METVAFPFSTAGPSQRSWSCQGARRILYICCKTVDRASLTSWLFAKHPDLERSTKSPLICEVGGKQKIS